MSMDMNTQLVDVALVSFFNLKHFASCSTVSHVKFKLVNVTTFILFWWIQSVVIQSERTSKRASFIEE